jgi:hypothetical protein
MLLTLTAFDNTGSQYDETGRYSSWWDNETRAAFEEKTECFVNQYAKFSIHFMSTANSLSVRTLPMPEVSTPHSRLGRSARRRRPAWAYQASRFSPMSNCSSSTMPIGGAERAPRRLPLNGSTLTHMHRNGHGSWALWPTQQTSRKPSIVRQRSRLATSGKSVQLSAQLMAVFIDPSQK